MAQITSNTETVENMQCFIDFSLFGKIHANVVHTKPFICPKKAGKLIIPKGFYKNQMISVDQDCTLVSTDIIS